MTANDAQTIARAIRSALEINRGDDEHSAAVVNAIHTVAFGISSRMTSLHEGWNHSDFIKACGTVSR